MSGRVVVVAGTVDVTVVSTGAAVDRGGGVEVGCKESAGAASSGRREVRGTLEVVGAL